MEFDAKPLEQMYGTFHVLPLKVGNSIKFVKYGHDPCLRVGCT
jgi:hypothetical protein